MGFVTIADLGIDVDARRRHRRPVHGGMGQAPSPTCFLEMPTNTAADEAQRRWLSKTEEEREALRAPHVAQIKASAAVVTDDQAKLQAEQRAVNEILEQVNRERVNPRLCVDVIRGLFYSTLGTPLSESLFTPEAVGRVKQSAIANGVPADQIETLFAQAKASLGPLPQQTPKQVVSEALEQIMASSGVSAAIPLSYTRERVLSIRDEASRRGVPYDQATRLLREEITRRVGITDSNPYADLEELIQRLGSPVVQEAYQPTLSLPPPPSVVVPTIVSHEPAVTQPQPSRPPRTRTDMRRVVREEPSGMPNWVVPAAIAAAGVGLAVLLTRRRD